MLKLFSIIVCIALTLVSATTAFANLPTQGFLPSKLANNAVVAAVEQCEQDGYAVSAAIVDRSGVVIAQLRNDSAGAHTIDSSMNKAYTSASLKEPTQKLAKLISKFPAIQALRDMNSQILILGGGFPIQINNEIVGGIGVGGAPGAHLDEKCARAGLKLLKAHLYQE